MIRKAVGNDLPEILEIYENARRFMAENGNPNQWGKTNPPQYTLERDIQLEQLYVVVREGKIRGVFAFIPGIDPTYGYIEGAWRSDAPYAAIHRVASDGAGGILDSFYLTGNFITHFAEQLVFQRKQLVLRT